MAIFEVVKTAPSHIEYLKGRLRDSDVQELWASTRLSPSAALDLAYRISSRSWTALLSEEPVIAFGVAPASKNLGHPWLLGSDKVNEIARYVTRRSLDYVNRMHAACGDLVNWVDARNLISIKWLRWCGFTIEEKEPYGVDKLMFHRFWKRNPLCVAP